MQDVKYPAFVAACDQFRQFLADQGSETDIVWIFREDIAEHGRRSYLRLPLRDQLDSVERLYAQACEQRLGVGFAVYGFLFNRPCCYLQVPRDPIEAEYWMMPDGVKFSIPTGLSRRELVPVRSWWRWLWCKTRETSVFADEIVPRRDCCSKESR